MSFAAYTFTALILNQSTIAPVASISGNVFRNRFRYFRATYQLFLFTHPFIFYPCVTLVTQVPTLMSSQRAG